MRKPEFWTLFGPDDDICGRFRSLRDAKDAAHVCESQDDPHTHTIVKVIMLGRAMKVGRLVDRNGRRMRAG